MDTPTPETPPAQPPVKLTQAGLGGSMGLLWGVSLVSGVAWLVLSGLEFEGDWAFAVAALTWGLSTTLAILVTVAWVMARRRLAAIARGEYRVRWSYTPQEWAAFHQAEWERVRGESRGWWTTSAILGGLFALLGGWLGQAAVEAIFVGALLGGALGFVCGAIGSGIEWLKGYRAWRRAEKGPTDSFMDDRGVYTNGQYHYVKFYGMTILRAQVIEGSPSVLEIQTRQSGGRNPVDTLIRVPIPAGHEQQAQHARDVLISS